MAAGTFSGASGTVCSGVLADGPGHALVADLLGHPERRALHR